jgi:hypothetical protein
LRGRSPGLACGYFVGGANTWKKYHLPDLLWATPVPVSAKVRRIAETTDNGNVLFAIQGVLNGMQKLK